MSPQSATPAPDWQADWAEALRSHGGPPPAGLRAWNGSDVAPRFEVHRHSVQAPLAEALADSFPVLQAQLGEDCFAALAAAFVRQHPPRSPVLLRWGAELAGFIDTLSDLADWPWLSDLARLEWARLQSLHAADAPTLPATAWADRLAEPARLARTRCRLHPSVHCLALRHAAASLWQAHQGHQDHPARQDGSAPQDTNPLRPEGVLLWRQGDALQLQRLAPDAVATWQALGDGLPLTQALALSPDPTADLARLIHHPLVCALDDAPTAS